jgi:apolipoprotein D and lipocalin family protein
MFFAALLVLAGCQSAPYPPITTVSQVDLHRFMGDWYVIANIPTFIEKGAHNAVESYRLATDGTIETTFTFRQDAFDGELKRYTPTGYVLDRETNAIWGMQFVWPIKADYRILYLAPDYSLTVIGRQARDYVWIMARNPDIAGTDYKGVIALLAREGYDVSRIQKVPQRWASDDDGRGVQRQAGARP